MRGLAAKFAKDVVASKAYKEQQEALGIKYRYSHSLPSTFVPDASVTFDRGGPPSDMVAQRTDMVRGVFGQQIR